MKKLGYLFCVSLLTLTCGCFRTADKDDGKGKCQMKTAATEHPEARIDAESLKARMAAEPDLTVINVLGKDTYEDCHIKGSINIPVAELQEASQSWNKAKQIVLYCASYICPASKQGLTLLKGLGFTNVLAYEGGMKEWREKGFESEGPCEAKYLMPEGSCKPTDMKPEGACKPKY